MVIVQLRAGETNYALYADLAANGDLVIAGHDVSRWLEDGSGRNEHECVYTVRADAVPRLCELLGVERGGLLEGLQRLLAPHGAAASATWRGWLQAHDVPYELAVR